MGLSLRLGLATQVLINDLLDLLSEYLRIFDIPPHGRCCMVWRYNHSLRIRCEDVMMN